VRRCGLPKTAAEMLRHFALRAGNRHDPSTLSSPHLSVAVRPFLGQHVHKSLGPASTGTRCSQRADTGQRSGSKSMGGVRTRTQRKSTGASQNCQDRPREFKQTAGTYAAMAVASPPCPSNTANIDVSGCCGRPTRQMCASCTQTGRVNKPVCLEGAQSKCAHGRSCHHTDCAATGHQR
jgi:hypothetical protein